MFVKTHSFLRLSFLLFVLFVLGSCKTTKNKFFNRSYHKTTTRYNWYFNANESYKSGVKVLETQHKDDFNELLSVYPLGTKKEAQSVAPQMDKALKKCAQAISKHSMLIKGVEHNRWIDDCYLLIGKSYFYKKEYIKAIEAFRLVSRQFEGLTTAYEAQIWLIKSFVESKDFSSADLILENVLSDENFPTELNKDLALIMAHYHIRLKDYVPAISELEEAISLTKKKREKSRYLYMVAQLHYNQNNYPAATDYFSKVIRISPDYEMTFNAKINRARSFDTSSGGSEQIKGELNKMLKDAKNKEFLDVIYFGLAELSNREGKLKEAVPLYVKSVSKSIRNDAQKSLSSVMLADIYYDQQNYRSSQAYYDTAVAFMNTNNERFLAASARQKTLTELITNLDIIEHQDSIQRVALMPEKERLAFIDKIIEEIKAEEQRLKALDNERRMDNNFFNDPRQNNSFNRMNQNKGGGWYFDNPNTLSFGFSEFNRKWGKRKLEDNWRRSDKKSQTVEEALADTIQEEEFDPKSRDSYIKELPLTIEAKKASNQMIIEAYFDAGVIYKEKLEDAPQAVTTFETLNSRFPKSDNRVMVLYFLYRLHKELGNIDFARDYKRLLLKEFPNSDYAKLIKDPAYADEMAQANSLLSADYEKAHQLYLQSKFKQCISLCERVNNKNPNNNLYPNFDFLRTMAKGFGMTKKNYMNALTLIVEKYPKHQVAESAKEILQFLQQETVVAGGGTDYSDGDSPYVNKPKAGHYFILLFKEYDLEVALAKSTLSNYHSEYYRLDRLNVSDLLFDQHTHMITVREFPNKAKAMSYYSAFKEGDVRGVFGEDYEVFVIASPNFPAFFKNKDIEGYQKSFEEYYLNEQ
jgi:tetratricopeptide (TPR) repeat protein